MKAKDRINAKREEKNFTLEEITHINNKIIFSKNLQRYLAMLGKDRKEVCKDLDLKYSTFCEWVTAKKYPRIDKIELLANYFGISKSDLIEDKSNTTTDISPDVKKLLTDYNKLNSSGKEKANEYVSDLTTISKYTENEI